MSKRDVVMVLGSTDRRGFLGLALGGLVVTAVGGLGGCSTAPLRVAVSPWAGYQFLILAEQEGWLPPEQIRLLRTQTLDASAEALAQGRVDAAALTLEEVLVLRSTGLRLHGVLIFNVSAGGDALLARPGIDSLSALAGKRIAVEDSSLGAVMLHHVLQAAGLDADAVTVEPMQFDHVAAWEQLAPDAIITYEPSLTLLQGRGLERLFDSRQMPRRILDLLAVREEALHEQGTALRTLIAAHFRALERWHRNPIDTGYRLGALLGVPAVEVKRVFSGLDLPDAVYNRQYLTPPAKGLTRTAREVADIMVQAGLLQQRPPLNELLLPDFLPPPAA
ncbi:hypothetical protein F2Q65_03440 [Thiohalocapsa marina]|uniref:SsuA/THI5-like domain-containing protein n=1 Tax=Thiohalocapsa marina TaxID=424902 RepID=A0A5M8FQP4_9GAMM|nr:ABC transporter substrate-binding protein [Thiohalocapsa marina]KAA6186954.1 hypothetical protein F2Q65_03440 [Thiohalocapsa marina]